MRWPAGWRSAHYIPYIPLSAAQQQDEEDADLLAVQGATHRGNGLRFVFLAIVGSLLSSVVSLTLYMSDTSPSTVADLVRRPALRRPSTFVGIENALSNGSHSFLPVVNFPRVVLQADAIDGRRALTEDDRVRPSQYGGVYSDDRHILVTPQVSTIVQFRNVDHGMERCVLSASIPDGGNHPGVGPAHVDVWFTHDEGELDPCVRGVWGEAPGRREFFTTLSLSPDGRNSSSPEFHCPSGAFTTLEVICSTAQPNCYVDFWQNQRARVLGGLYVIQSQ